MKKISKKKHSGSSDIVVIIYLIGTLIVASKGFAESLLAGNLYRVVMQVQNFDELMFNIINLSIWVLFIALFYLAGQVLYQKSCVNFDYGIRKKVIEKICKIPMSSLSKQEEVKWIGVLGRDTETFSESYKTTFVSILGALISIIGGIAVLYIYNIQMCLFFVGCGFFYYFSIALLKNRALSAQKIFIEVLSKAESILNEILRGIQVIRFYQLRDIFANRYNSSIKEINESGEKNIRITAAAGTLRNFGYSFTYIGSLIFGLVLIKNNQLDVADFMYIWSIGMNVAHSMQYIAFQIVELQQKRAALLRIKEIGMLPVEELGIERENSFKDNAEAISFENITFGFESSNSVICDLNLSINKGEKIAIVGASGGGKSTIAKLIMRFFEPQQGDIKIYGVSIKEMSLRDLRKRITYLPQAPFLFNETIYDNLKIVTENADENDIIGACKKAGILDRIGTFPNGLFTVVGENGKRLSGGERQRLGIAQCYLKDSDIWIMDEVSSAVDVGLEEEITKNIFQLPEKTVICITHRLAAAKLADRIIVFDKGKVAEVGKHEELLNRRGVYARIVIEKND